MYLLSKDSYREMRSRLLRIGLSFFAVGVLIIIGICRLSGFPPLSIVMGIVFYAAGAAVIIPRTSTEKVKKLSSLRYELNVVGVRVWNNSQDESFQTFHWQDVTQFDVALKKNMSYVVLATREGGRLRISNADLFVSDSGEPMLPIAAAYYLGRTAGGASGDIDRQVSVDRQ